MPASDNGAEQNLPITAEEWNLRFLAEFARMLAKRPGTEFDLPGDAGYRVEELALVGRHVTLVWSFPGVTNDGRGPCARRTVHGPGGTARRILA